MTLRFACAGLDVPPAVRTQVADDDVAARLAAEDPTLWGPDAAAGTAARLGWLDLPSTSRELVPRLAALRAELQAEGLDRVVLCGTGGSALAAEAACRTAGVPLVVLDGTDPGQVAAATAELERTVVVVTSGTETTDAHRRAFVTAFAAAGLDEARIGTRFVVVTGPGSPLAQTAAAMGARAVFLAEPGLGSRYGALSAFALVPAALAGADVGALLDEAVELAEDLVKPDNPALELGVALGAGFRTGRDKVALADGGSSPAGFAGWAEQLIAGSTGTQGRGLLPVVVESVDAPGATGADTLLAVVGGDPVAPGPSVGVTGPLGAQFLAWEYATAVAGRVLGIDPFDRPDPDEEDPPVPEDGVPEQRPAATIGAVQLSGVNGVLDAVDLSQHDGVALALAAVLAAVPPRGYLAVTAHLDPGRDARAAALRAALAAHGDRAVTFGWGPRTRSTTGPYHQDGPQTGVFLQITGDVDDDLPVPDRPYSFGDLQAAQAAADRQAVADRGRPLLHLHLTDRAAGIGQLLDALG
ncbi:MULTISPECIES: glucose-6-phosphate isomerase [unclassified Geodermatophilus]|uniref:glucose-6-phosphate isomerase n=1 Tax=unclassified Geodermatophilus TaxID=2637632 RepID=UPI003EECD16F